MKFIKRKSIIILALLIWALFQHYKIQGLETMQAEFINKTDVTFWYLIENEDSTLKMAEKLDQLSKSKDWNEMNLLLGELSFIRNEWIETHLNIIHQTNTLTGIKEEIEKTNEFTLMSKQAQELWQSVFFTQADFMNVSLYVKQPKKPDFEKTKSLFASLSMGFSFINDELEIIKNRPRNWDAIDSKTARFLKHDYIEKTSIHLKKIQLDFDSFLATRKG
jgi:hypothetical protein